MEVWDHGWIDPDDLIVQMDWASPYSPATNGSSLSGADYRVNVEFAK